MAQHARSLRVGHTAITWEDGRIEEAIRTLSELGYHAIEIFSWTLNDMRSQGRLGLFEKYGIPLTSSYFSVDIVDPAAREAELKKLADWGALLQSVGGTAATLGGNSVDRRTFDFGEHRAYITQTVNVMASCLGDVGIQLNFHPHTGTPVETESEIRGLMDGVNHSRVGFAPDVGQIQKGGSDPLQVLNDYLELVRLVHVKDFGGTVEFDEDGTEIDSTGFVCYTPLGQGVVDLPEILDTLEASDYEGYLMVELDPGEKMPMTAAEAARANRDYLEGLGYSFVQRG